MPNWCENNLIITGTKERLDEIQATKFNFDKIIPMPIEFKEDSDTKNIGGSISKKSFECCFNQQDRVEDYDWDKLQKERNLTDSEISYWQDLTRKHGACGWYEWSYKNWGTKWNASSVSMDRVSPTILHVYFATPWGSPMPILERVSHGVTIDYTFDIEGNESGCCIIENGISTQVEEIENTKNGHMMFLGGPPEKGWDEE